MSGLEVIRKSFEHGSILAFHLSHLLLRVILLPNSQDSFLIFRRLHTHQTIQMIMESSIAMDFK
jgi:hypothetical protein